MHTAGSHYHLTLDAEKCDMDEIYSQKLRYRRTWHIMKTFNLSEAYITI